MVYAGSRRGQVCANPPRSRVVSAMSGAVITATLIGDDTTRPGDIVSRGRSPVFGLCRALLAAGADPEARLDCDRSGVLALRVKSIGIGGASQVAYRGTIHSLVRLEADP